MTRPGSSKHDDAAVSPAASGRTHARAFAPASIGNVGVGFDLLGLVIAGAGDTVEARRIEDPGVVRIDAIHVRDHHLGAPELPTEPARNTAGRAVQALLAHVRPGFGVALTLHKGIPYGSGMGGSAASAVAALVAANALLEQPLPQAALYPFALDGEQVASGGRHGDNVAPMLLGGLVMSAGEDAPRRLPVPAGVFSVLVHPHCVVETRAARAVLAEPYPIATAVAQQALLARFLVGLHAGDLALVRAGLADVLVEPRRAALVPGFAAVKAAALDAGALGASLSGAGPSVFAWCEGRGRAEAAAVAMRAAFAAAGLDSEAYVSPLDAPAAHLLED